MAVNVRLANGTTVQAGGIFEFARIGRIPNLAVVAEHRGHGVATALLRHAVDWMRGRGMAMASGRT